MPALFLVQSYIDTVIYIIKLINEVKVILTKTEPAGVSSGCTDEPRVRAKLDRVSSSGTGVEMCNPSKDTRRVSFAGKEEDASGVLGYDSGC